MDDTYNDLILPNTTITRIIKGAMPGNMNLKKNAKQLFNQIGAVFVLYITYKANTLVKRSKRKIITSADILNALNASNFDSFVPVLTEILNDRKEQLQRKKQCKTSGSKQNSKDVENESETFLTENSEDVENESETFLRENSKDGEDGSEIYLMENSENEENENETIINEDIMET